MKKWQKLSSKKVFETPYFSVSANRFTDSQGYEDDFYRFEFTDWATVVPELPSGDIIMISIYRFGIEDYVLEFPGGMVKSGYSHEEAVTEELLEETGYEAGTIKEIGFTYPNPATQPNKCIFYHATNLKKVNIQNLEKAEDIDLKIIKKEEFPNLVYENKIFNSMSLLTAHAYLRTIGACCQTGPDARMASTFSEHNSENEICFKGQGRPLKTSYIRKK